MRTEMGRELLIVSADILCYTVTKSMRQSPMDMQACLLGSLSVGITMQARFENDAEERTFHIMRKISLIVPCYNEEEALPIFYKEVARVSAGMPEFEFEFLFVDDGSKDRTLEVLQEISAEDERVFYYSFERNQTNGS